MSLQVKIGFVGAGAMAQAIAEGLLTSGTLSPDNILASATSSRFRAWWEQRGVKFSEDNHSVIQVRTVITTYQSPVSRLQSPPSSLSCPSHHVTDDTTSNPTQPGTYLPIDVLRF